MLDAAVFRGDTVVNIVGRIDYANTMPFLLGVAVCALALDLASDVGTTR